MDRTNRSTSLADSSFGLIRRTARSWASTFPVFQSARANSWLGWIFFASARRSPCLTPNWLSPAPHLALCFRVASLPSALSCLRVSLRVMVVIPLNELAVGRGLDAVQLGAGLEPRVLGLRRRVRPWTRPARGAAA